MVYNILPSRQVKNYLKKCKDRVLKQYFVEILYEKIAVDPKSGIPKQGDLSGIWTMGFTYKNSHYRIAYRIVDHSVIPIIMIGSHENFYRELKRVLKY